jgi:uncharacterized protein
VAWPEGEPPEPEWPEAEERLPPVANPQVPAPVFVRQSWRDIVFVHWPMEPSRVRGFFPSGTRPDTFEGQTYVGIVAFAIRSIRLGGVVEVGTTYEVNVRLYSVDRDGRQGVVFLSMDVTRPDMVAAARALLWLPYMWSRIEPVSGGAGYRVERRHGPPVRGVVEVEAGEPLPAPSPLEVFLTARWGLHARTVLGTTWVPLGHGRWPLHRATLRQADQSLLAAAGLPLPAQEAMGVLWAPALDDAGLGRPVRCRS